MITVPSLDPCTDILDTDEIMITHQNGSTDTISGANFNKRNQVIISANTTLSGTPLKPGNVVRVLFTEEQSASNGSTAFVINYNTENITVKVCKSGALTNYIPFTTSNGLYKYCQAYTFFELLYDGTNFIIMGNPVVWNALKNTIYANGTNKINQVKIDATFPDGNTGEVIEFPINNGTIYLLYSATYSGRYCVFLIIPGYNNITIQSLINNGFNCTSTGSGTNMKVGISRASWIIEPTPVTLISL